MKRDFPSCRKINALSLCSRAISLCLALVMLCNMGTEALGAAVATQDMSERLLAELEVKGLDKGPSPSEFLANLREELEKAMNANSSEQEPLPTKYTQSEFQQKYLQELNKQYNTQVKKLDEEFQKALTQFDEQADEERTRIMAAMLTDDSVSGEWTQLEMNLSQKRAEYETYLSGEKEKLVAELQTDKDNMRAKKSLSSAYAQYSKDFDKAMQEAEQAQLEFYRDLISKVYIQYNQTKDYKDKENFISIITYLSSLSNKDKIFNTPYKEDILKALWLNFTVKSHACRGFIKTEFKASGTYGTSFIGGSPSAGKIADVQMNKEQVFRLENEKACNLALSSLIPFANLNGEGWKITNFMQDNFNNPLFGQILFIGAKALMLTNNGGLSALDAFVDKAIEKENNGTEKTTWDALNILSFEGLNSALAWTDGTYFAHNVSSAAEREPGEPNVWEDVAQMLVQKNTPQATRILKKAIDQCKVLSKDNRAYASTTPKKQVLSCNGIYPFLFGVITQKPELADEMFIQPLFPEQPGKYAGSYQGNQRDFYVTDEEARQNRAYNRANGLEYKKTKGEILAWFFYDSMFSDLYPADKQRMDSKLAGVALLNPKRQMTAYSKDSDRYKSLQNKFNAKIVFVALGAVFDYAISLLLIKDIGKLLLKTGLVVKGASNALKVRQVIMSYKLVPASLGKSAAIAHALQVKNLGTAHLNSYKQFVAKINKIKTKAIKVRQFPSNVETRFRETVNRFRETNAQQFHFGQTRTVNFNAEQRAGTQGFGRDYAAAWRTTSSARDYAYARATSAEVPHTLPLWTQPQRIENFSEFYNTYLSGAWNFTKGIPAKVLNGTKNYLRNGGLTRYTKESSGGTPLNTQHLTVKLFDKTGRPLEIKEISVKDGVLYINGEMAKTFKAYLPVDKLESLAGLTREENLALGFDGMWVKLVSKTKPTAGEKLAALNKDVVTVPLYDAAGNPILHVGFNPGIKAEKTLLEMLAGENPSAKLVFNDGKFQLFGNNGALLRTLEEIEEISIPKTAFNNVMKANKPEFLNKLFALDKGTSEALRIEQTKNKLFWPMAVNTLSFSAGASALTLTLQDPDFGFSYVGAFAASLALPYATSFLAPVVAPFVSKFGARRVMNTAFGLAATSLGVTLGFGNWRGHGNQKDENGKIIGSVPLLMLNAGLTGLSSTLIRASSGVMIKGYELGAKTLTTSMAWKGVGGLVLTTIPYLYHEFQLGRSAITGKEPAKDVDFSSGYWFLAPASVVTMIGLRMTMPKMAKPGFKLSGSFAAPWKLWVKKEVFPYWAGMTLMSGLESYAFFTGISKWNRDHLTGKNNGWSDPTYKFWGALFTAVPQFIARTRLVTGMLNKTGIARKPWYVAQTGAADLARKSHFGKGAFNSAVLATAGTGLFMLDTDSPTANLALGLASGFLLGKGTANIFQYNQKLLINSVKKGLGADKVPAAQVIYSGTNIGLALPIVYAAAADKRAKTHPEEDEVTGVRKTVWMPLLVYALGGGLIFGAEKQAFNNFVPSISKGWHATQSVLSPVAKPVFLGTVLGGNALLRINQTVGTDTPTPAGDKLITPTLVSPTLNLKMPTMLQGGKSGLETGLFDGKQLSTPSQTSPDNLLDQDQEDELLSE